MTQRLGDRGQNTSREVVMDFRESTLVKKARTKPILTSNVTEVVQGLKKSAPGASSSKSGVSGSFGGSRPFEGAI